MSNTMKEKVVEAGHAVAEAAKGVGHKIAEGTERAAGFVKEKAGAAAAAVAGNETGLADVKERMNVIASCGKKVGVVDHVETGAIKLTMKDCSDGKHHFIPAGWIDRVDSSVHLKKNSAETEKNWKSDAGSCGC